MGVGDAEAARSSYGARVRAGDDESGANAPCCGSLQIHGYQQILHPKHWNWLPDLSYATVSGNESGVPVQPPVHPHNPCSLKPEEQLSRDEPDLRFASALFLRNG